MGKGLQLVMIPSGWLNGVNCLMNGVNCLVNGVNFLVSGVNGVNCLVNSVNVMPCSKCQFGGEVLGSTYSCFVQTSAWI